MSKARRRGDAGSYVLYSVHIINPSTNKKVEDDSRCNLVTPLNDDENLHAAAL